MDIFDLSPIIHTVLSHEIGLRPFEPNCGRGGDQTSLGVGGMDDKGKENGGSGDGANGGAVQPNFSGGSGVWRGGGFGAPDTFTNICGGGGGSGHIGSGVAGETKSGKGQQCPMQDDPDYLPGIGIGGEGGEYGENGGNGLVVIRWQLAMDFFFHSCLSAKPQKAVIM